MEKRKLVLTIIGVQIHGLSVLCVPKRGEN